MHCTLCLTQASHGFCLSHLTFRLEQRMQAKVGFVGDMLGEHAGGFMVNGNLGSECD